MRRLTVLILLTAACQKVEQEPPTCDDYAKSVLMDCVQGSDEPCTDLFEEAYWICLEEVRMGHDVCLDYFVDGGHCAKGYVRASTYVREDTPHR